ncbi:hypothetical protein [Photobacterium galatheae]|uniref:Uncharacterized protein n=1 Tax=Photobacterium galatheae TaxID=1654360 RepID=A0A066RLQ5_9GAMM|nr:hypothetical protein [Photobacterium galatheae]KDM91380.1 hypothetical protein EA58_12535 [Photobacterium galatheae]MCM0151639.1 hypothetical protein [Photobacterium galatheae]
MFSLMLDGHRAAARLKRGDLVSISGSPADIAPLEAISKQPDGSVWLNPIGQGKFQVNQFQQIAVYSLCRGTGR